MKPLAPCWHTAGLMFVIAAVAATGSLLSRYRDASTAVIAPSMWAANYLAGIAVNCGLLVYVARIGRERWRLEELVGRRWTYFGGAATDLLLAGAAWLLIEAAELAAVQLGGAQRGAIEGLLPTTAVARVAWCAVALTAGFCEEVVYRGYLRTELGARTKSPWAGVFLQAVFFGLAHAEQGGGAALRVGVYGLGLGALARARGSLIPGVVCHVCVDLVSGLHPG